jgi:outer membrane protein assembly factor BamE (lipoprotein component of BamABCDE complex)
MKRGAKLCVALATCLATFAACRSPAARTSSAQASRLSEERTKQNVRKLRATLPGKPMKTVVGILGQPSQVFTLENREIWDYKDAAYDPVTGRTVRSLQIFYVDRRVDSVNFSY